MNYITVIDWFLLILSFFSCASNEKKKETKQRKSATVYLLITFDGASNCFNCNGGFDGKKRERESECWGENSFSDKTNLNPHQIALDFLAAQRLWAY